MLNLLNRTTLKFQQNKNTIKQFVTLKSLQRVSQGDMPISHVTHIHAYSNQIYVKFILNRNILIAMQLTKMQQQSSHRGFNKSLILNHFPIINQRMVVIQDWLGHCALQGRVGRVVPRPLYTPVLCLQIAVQYL